LDAVILEICKQQSDLVAEVSQQQQIELIKQHRHVLRF